MPRQVYSTRFAAAVLTSGTTTFYTVPADKVVVLRTMTLGWQTLAKAAGTSSVFINASNSRIWSVNHPVSNFGSAIWEGRLVLPPGERLRAGTSATGTIYFTASGYLLSLL